MADAPAFDQAAAYDAVRYPAGVFRRTHPDRMAVVARLHGLDPPPVETARVLEIGGGDGMNLIALAVAFPDARFLEFDIAPSAVARGQAWVREVGLGNIRMEARDVIEAAETLDERFDYVLAHGVYAWVHAPVRAAVMKLIGRVLAPDGVALLTYNAMPGGHLRLALREMVLPRIAPIAAVDDKIAAAKAILADYAEAREGDAAFVAALRTEAKAVSERNGPVLWHDELNVAYEPQSITEVATAAAAAGLRYLGDADAAMIEDGFLPDEAEDRSTGAAVRAAQAEDYRVGRLFRHSVLVREAVSPARRLDSAPLAALHVAIPGSRTGPHAFACGKSTFEIDDPPLADRIEGVMRRWPGSVPVSEAFAGKAARDTLFRLFQANIAELSTLPARFATTPGERPVASPLARAIARGGGEHIPTLDQRTVGLAEPGPRALLALLDGTRDRAQLAADWAASGVADPISIDAALRAFAATALLTG